GASHRANGGAAHILLEVGRHLATAKCSERTARAGRWAAGIFLGHLSEVRTTFDSGFQFVRFLFGADQNVACGGLCHGVLLFLENRLSLTQNHAGSEAPGAGSTPAVSISGLGSFLALGRGNAMTQGNDQ